MSINSVTQPELQMKSQDHKQPRKRNRIPVACSICRKRKVKCDRGRPHCDVCQRYNVAHLCYYQEPSWSQNSFRKLSDSGQEESKANLGQDVSSGFSNESNNILISHDTKSDNSKEGLSSDIETAPSSMGRISVPMESRAPKADRFDNNIHNLIHPSTTAGQSRNTKMLGFEDHMLSFQNYRNYNPHQSSERSTANFPQNLTSNPPAQLSSLIHEGAPQNSLTHVPVKFMHHATPISSTSRTEGSSPAIQSELNRMKQKIKEIEASITLSKTFATLTPKQYSSEHAWSVVGHSSNQKENTSLTQMSTSDLTDLMELSNPIVSGDAEGEPNIDSNERIDFYEKYISVHAKQRRLVNHGPLSLISLLKRDRFSNLLFMKTIESRKKRFNFPQEYLKKRRADEGDFEVEITKDNSGSLTSPYLPVKSILEKSFHRKMLERDGFVDVQPYEKEKFRNHTLSTRNSDSTLNQEGQSDEALLMKRIEDMLPPKKVIWITLEKFFKYWYPFCPYVDQEMFYEDVTKLIGKRFDDNDDNDRVKNISFENKLSFSTIGLLLLFMRFGYLSATIGMDLVTNEGTKLSDEAGYLLKHVVGSSFAETAQSCLNLFQYMRQTTLGIFQLAMYLRLYHGYAPEEGMCPDGVDSIVYGGLLVEMGISLGLNRDPISFGLNDRMVNLWRKLWAGLLLIDFKQAFSLGNPPIIREKFFDTESPLYHGTKFSNHSDLEIEKGTVDLLIKNLYWSRRAKELSDIIINLKNPPKLIDVIEKLKDLESLVSLEFHSLSSVLLEKSNSHVENFSKVKRIAVYLEMQTSIHVTYHHILIHLEEKKDFKSALYFVKKIAVNIVETIAAFLPLLKKLSKHVGEGFHWYLIPKLEMSMHKTLQVQYSLIVRTEHLKYMARSQKTLTPELDSALNSFRRVLYKNCETYLKGLSKLSDRYYYAWRMSKSHSIVLDILENISQNFFETNENNSLIEVSVGNTKISAPDYNFLLVCSVCQINQLTKLFDPLFLDRDISKTSESFTFDDDLEYKKMLNNPDVDNMWFGLMSGASYSDENNNNNNNIETSLSVGNKDIFDTSTGINMDLDSFFGSP